MILIVYNLKEQASGCIMTELETILNQSVSSSKIAASISSEKVIVSPTLKWPNGSIAIQLDFPSMKLEPRWIFLRRMTISTIRWNRLILILLNTASGNIESQNFVNTSCKCKTLYGTPLPSAAPQKNTFNFLILRSLTGRVREVRSDSRTNFLLTIKFKSRSVCVTIFGWH